MNQTTRVDPMVGQHHEVIDRMAEVGVTHGGEGRVTLSPVFLARRRAPWRVTEPRVPAAFMCQLDPIEPSTLRKSHPGDGSPIRGKVIVRGIPEKLFTKRGCWVEVREAHFLSNGAVTITVDEETELVPIMGPEQNSCRF